MAQIIPLENSKINHLITGFSVPCREKTVAYRLEVANDMYTDEKQFSKNISITKESQNNRVIAELPEFGKHYTWRMKYLNRRNKVIGSSILYHFATAVGPEVDSTKFRLRILNNHLAGSGLLILTDSKAVIYNTEGKPVWFWPEVGDDLLRDFKPTQNGTFTFISPQNCYEVDYYGKVVWQRPTAVDRDSALRFHHELTKLTTGNYMVCSYEFMYEEIPTPSDSELIRNPLTLIRREGKYFRKDIAGTLVELDKQGKEVWRWSSATVIPKSAMDAQQKIKHPNAILPGGGAHMNSFYFQEQDSVIYISFRNINTILKIEYPSGRLITTYGRYKNGNFSNQYPDGDTLFIHQHHAGKTSKNELSIFNNNTSNGKMAPSKIVLFKESDKNDGNLQKSWEFSCDIDSNTPPGVMTGGSVYELPNGSFIGCAGQNGRIFVVDRSKKVLWNALPEIFDTDGTPSVLTQYRANYLYQNELDRYIYRVNADSRQKKP